MCACLKLKSSQAQKPLSVWTSWRDGNKSSQISVGKTRLILDIWHPANHEGHVRVKHKSSSHFYKSDSLLTDSSWYYCTDWLGVKRGSKSNKEFSTNWTHFAVNVSQAVRHIISVTVFNFTHRPVLTALLLIVILSASRFLTPDSPLLVPFAFSVLVSSTGGSKSNKEFSTSWTLFAFLSNRNPFWAHSDVT